jgi:hypothetical protein
LERELNQLPGIQSRKSSCGGLKPLKGQKSRWVIQKPFTVDDVW